MKVIEIGVKNKITQKYFMEFRFYLQPVTRLDKQDSGSKLLSGVHSPFYNKENELIPEINSSKVML